MRSPTRVAIAAALLCAACGNYSTEDLEFLAALPERASLRAQVPASAAVATGAVLAAAAPDACVIGTAEVWLQSKPASDSWNKGVDHVIGLIDHVRAYSPSWRSDDGESRGWGPFDDERHPGHEIQVLMSRSHPAELSGAPRYTYAFQGRPKGTQAFTTLLAGVFDGPSASHGKGYVGLDFPMFWTLGMNDADTPHGLMEIAYDRTPKPPPQAATVIYLKLSAAGLGMEQFEYAFQEWDDRSGAFAYKYTNGNGDVLTVQTSYDAAGAGRDQVSYVAAGGATGWFQQCWDVAACLVYVNDPWNFTCGAPPCNAGSLSACATVPATPF